MKLRRVFAIFLPLLLITAAVGLCFGSVRLSAAQFFAAITGRGEETVEIILFSLRLPRVLGGILAGMGLAISGALLQTVTGNELASPNILGINSGAGLAVIAMLTLLPGASVLLPFGAFFGAFAAALIILLAASRLGGSRVGILLIGIAVTTLLNSAISLCSLLDEGILAQYNHFTVGSLQALGMEQLPLPALIIFAAFAGAMVLSHRLRLLCLGDAAASALGVRVKGLRILALALAAASAAAAVSFAGLLGFVGLVVPHIASRLVGRDPRKMLPTATLLGALVVTLGDLLGRTLFAPSELPVGIVMSLIGAPYFLFLLCRRKYAENF